MHQRARGGIVMYSLCSSPAARALDKISCFNVFSAQVWEVPARASTACTCLKHVKMRALHVGNASHPLPGCLIGVILVTDPAKMWASPAHSRRRARAFQMRAGGKGARGCSQLSVFVCILRCSQGTSHSSTQLVNARRTILKCDAQRQSQAGESSQVPTHTCTRLRQAAVCCAFHEQASTPLLVLAPASFLRAGWLAAAGCCRPGA